MYLPTCVNLMLTRLGMSTISHDALRILASPLAAPVYWIGRITITLKRYFTIISLLIWSNLKFLINCLKIMPAFICCLFDANGPLHSRVRPTFDWSEAISQRTSSDSKRKLERAQFMSDFELEMYHFRNNHAQSFLVRVWKWKFCVISSQFTFLVKF